LNYREEIEKCIEFIEDHIKEDITVEEIAGHAGYSLYHFCRVFNLFRGVSIMEYVRGRRLSLAAAELFNGRKIIDIALDLKHQADLPRLFVKPTATVPHSI